MDYKKKNKLKYSFSVQTIFTPPEKVKVSSCDETLKLSSLQKLALAKFKSKQWHPAALTK